MKRCRDFDYEAFSYVFVPSSDFIRVDICVLIEFL